MGLSVLVALLLAAGGCPSDDDKGTANSDGGTAGKGAVAGKGGADNSVTATFSDGRKATFSGGVIAARGRQGTIEELSITFTEGSDSGRGALEVNAGKRVADFVFTSNGTMGLPITEGTFDFKAGDPSTGVVYFGTAVMREFDADCKEKEVLRSTGEYAGTVKITELTADHVRGSWDAQSKDLVTRLETARLGGSFSVALEKGSVGGVKCVK